jgi:hypothetical protein
MSKVDGSSEFEMPVELYHTMYPAVAKMLQFKFLSPADRVLVVRTGQGAGMQKGPAKPLWRKREVIRQER